MYVYLVLTSIDGLHAVRPRDMAARHHPGGQGGAGELPAQLVACKGEGQNDGPTSTRVDSVHSALPLSKAEILICSPF